MKPLNTMVDENLIKKVKMLSVQKDTTIQKLLDEAVRDLLVKYNISLD